MKDLLTDKKLKMHPDGGSEVNTNNFRQASMNCQRFLTRVDLRRPHLTFVNDGTVHDADLLT